MSDRFLTDVHIRTDDHDVNQLPDLPDPSRYHDVLRTYSYSGSSSSEEEWFSEAEEDEDSEEDEEEWYSEEEPDTEPAPLSTEPEPVPEPFSLLEHCFLGWRRWCIVKKQLMAYTVR